MRCTRRLTFCAGHRVLGHEGKCAHPHGHNYVAELTAEGDLDELGRVVDFGVIKEKIGGWLDANWDHAFLINEQDAELFEALDGHGWRVWTISGNPTAEVLARMLLLVAQSLVREVRFTRVRVHETENCYADAVPGQ